MKEDKKQSKTVTRGGLGFTGLLTIAFIILKLCGVINWSWWWVLSPIIISTGLGLIILIIALIIAIIAGVLEVIVKNL